MKQYYLGIEFGSTRVKAVLIDGEHRIVKSGDYTWKSSLENGVWTYHMEDVQTGLRTAIRNLGELPGAVSAMGISGMMHGYLAFDKDWNLLAPFRTWQNTMTGEAAEQLTAEFGFNIPQRWSIAHLYQAILMLENEEECYHFFQDLCTISELRSMEQRFEVAMLLNDGMIYNDILEKTGVSSATISRVNRCLLNGAGGYESILDKIQAQREKQGDEQL